MPTFAVALSVWLAAGTSTHSGKIIGVTDGDTVKLLTPDKEELRIRLACIDAPEKAQTKSMHNLVCVERTAAPEGMNGGKWCRYVIVRDGSTPDASTIVGYRRGTVQQVTAHAKHCVDQLNARATGVSPYRLRRSVQRGQKGSQSRNVTQRNR